MPSDETPWLLSMPTSEQPLAPSFHLPTRAFLILEEGEPTPYGTWMQTGPNVYFSFHAELNPAEAFAFKWKTSPSIIHIHVGFATHITLFENPSSIPPKLYTYVIDEKAHLQHIAFASTATAEFLVKKSAHLNHLTWGINADLCQKKNSIQLLESQAEVDWRECYLCNHRQMAETHVKIEHCAPETSSHCCVKTVLQGKSQCAFRGDIFLHETACHAKTKQRNFNHLLSPQAHVISLPRLHIYNKNVTATHGSATQPLREENLFYLQSRGLSHIKAQQLYLSSFLRETYTHLLSFANLFDPRLMTALHE